MKILCTKASDEDKRKAPEQNLTFNVLKERLKPKLELSSFNMNTLKTLNLYSAKQVYNIAAYLLADKNDMPGLDIAVYRNNTNEYRKRGLSRWKHLYFKKSNFI